MDLTVREQAQEGGWDSRFESTVETSVGLDAAFGGE